MYFGRAFDEVVVSLGSRPRLAVAKNADKVDDVKNEQDTIACLVASFEEGHPSYFRTPPPAPEEVVLAP